MLTCPRSILHTPGLEGWRGQKESSLWGFSSFPFLPFSWTRLYGSLNPVCLIGFGLELISSVSPLTKDRVAEVDISKNCVCSTLLFLHQLVRSWGESHAGWADGRVGGNWNDITPLVISSVQTTSAFARNCLVTIALDFLPRAIKTASQI